MDKVAASGGYLMACVGSQILASPFAYIGSIGVYSATPNVHEFLKKHNISYEEFTAGKYKRNVTPFSEVTEEKRKQLLEQLGLIHNQFKNFVKKYRNLDMDKVGTGDHWLAEEAMKKGLVDKLQCSDDFILEKMKTHNVYKVSFERKKSFVENLSKKAKTEVEEFLSEDSNPRWMF